MAITKYTLFVADEATDFARSTKATVVAEADSRRKGGEKSGLSVRTGTGFVAYELKPVKQRIITVHTKPFTKVVELPTEQAGVVPEGYVPAYIRSRKDATVLRNESAEEASRYAVVRLSTGVVIGYAGTTREAGALMTAEPKAVKVA